LGFEWRREMPLVWEWASGSEFAWVKVLKLESD
jgi:hypothetical protein